RKEIDRNRRDANAFRRTVQTRQRDATGVDYGEVFETVLRTIAEVEVVDVRQRKVFHVSRLQVVAGKDQAIRILVRKLPQQDAVGDAEDRRARADGQGDRDDNGDGENRALAQRAKRVEEVG